jgi:L-alanine-DL-glutamate epimerase-like enolase superfamily enzyme
MKITGIETFPFRLPTRRDFWWASLQVPLGGFVFVEVTTDTGLTGFGEATPLPDWGGDHGRHGGETQQTVINIIRSTISPALIGVDPTAIELAHMRMDRVLRGNNYARCAVDIALHDLWGKALGQPIYRLLGGAVRNEVRIAHMIGIMPTEEAVAEARAVMADGVSAFQIKAGRDPMLDVQTVKAVRDAVGPGIFLRLDVNQGYGRAKSASRILGAMAGSLDMVEQPVRDLTEMAELRGQSSIDLIADESCWDEFDALDLVKCRGADAISIYLAKAGGIARARRVAAIADAAGLPCDVNGSIESAIGTAGNVHFALAANAVSLPSVISITAPRGKGPCKVAGRYYLDDIVDDAFPFARGAISPLEGPGLGIEINRQKLEQFRERELAQ